MPSLQNTGPSTPSRQTSTAPTPAEAMPSTETGAVAANADRGLDLDNRIDDQSIATLLSHFQAAKAGLEERMRSMERELSATQRENAELRRRLDSHDLRKYDETAKTVEAHERTALVVLLRMEALESRCRLVETKVKDHAAATQAGHAKFLRGEVKSIRRQLSSITKSGGGKVSQEKRIDQVTRLAKALETSVDNVNKRLNKLESKVGKRPRDEETARPGDETGRPIEKDQVNAPPTKKPRLSSSARSPAPLFPATAGLPGDLEAQRPFSNWIDAFSNKNTPQSDKQTLPSSKLPAMPGLLGSASIQGTSSPPQLPKHVTEADVSGHWARLFPNDPYPYLSAQFASSPGGRQLAQAAEPSVSPPPEHPHDELSTVKASDDTEVEILPQS